MDCILCNSNKTKLFYSQKKVPIYQNFLFSCYKEAINCKTGDIDLVYCYNCSFVYNKSFQSELIDYSINYENTQFYSNYFQKYIDRLINFLISNFKNINGVLEIGCGKGNFLKKLSNKIPNINFYGFDKALTKSSISKNLKLFNYYYHKDLKLDFNLVILRHVLEHVYDPINFLKDNINLKDNIFIEVPSFEWIIDNNAYWDIFYEHCNYFTEKSLNYLLKKIGFANIEIIKEFNQQYFWIINNKSDNLKVNEININIDIFLKNKNEFSEKIKNLITKNKCYIWGAGAKGISFCNYFDPDNKFIEGIIDINPNKQNKYCPKTGHKIISPLDINKKIDYILVMNPNYKNEIYETLKQIDNLLTRKLSVL